MCIVAWFDTVWQGKFLGKSEELQGDGVLTTTKSKMPTPQFTNVIGMYWQRANFLKIQLPGHQWPDIQWLRKFSLNFGTNIWNTA
jgi:hypothetical protein